MYSNGRQARRALNGSGTGIDRDVESDGVSDGVALVANGCTCLRVRATEMVNMMRDKVDKKGRIGGEGLLRIVNTSTILHTSFSLFHTFFQLEITL
jgi:hypothetical protein